MQWSERNHRMTPDLYFSEHALLRMAQRNLSFVDVAFVVAQGTRYWRTGALHIVLLYKDIPSAERRLFTRLDGTVVLLDDTGTVVKTVYRGNPKQVCKAIRSKTKLDLKKNRSRIWPQMTPDYPGMAAD
jgi:hypothetical protein